MQNQNALQVLNGQNFVLPVPVEAMRNLLLSRKDLIVKIGNTYEISRPLALELYRLLVQEVVKAGGSIRESVRLEVGTPEMVVVSLSVHICIGQSEVVFTELGEAYGREKGKEDTLARTAYTRAFKRVLERIAGEDFINQVILKLFPEAKPMEAPASDRQKEFIQQLISEKRLTDGIITTLKQENVLPPDFVLEKALQDGTLTFSQAKAIISKALGKGK